MAEGSNTLLTQSSLIASLARNYDPFIVHHTYFVTFFSRVFLSAVLQRANLTVNLPIWIPHSHKSTTLTSSDV